MDTSEFRLKRLFSHSTGRAMVVAFDRGLGASVRGGGEHAHEIVRAVVDSGVEGILLSPGLLAKSRQFLAHRNAPLAIVRSDFIFMGDLQPDGTSGPAEEYRRLISAREAVALGADALVMFLILGNQSGAITADNAEAIARVSAEAHEVGLPLIVETVLWGSRVSNHADPEALLYVNRLAVELGADALKTQYTGDKDTMREIVDSCPVPVMVLGGPKVDDRAELEMQTKDALEAGVKGVVYGRNVWQADDPCATARDLHQLVHGL